MELDLKLSISTIVSALIVAVGWLVNGWLQRRNEVAKKKTEYRLQTLISFFDLVDFIVTDKESMLDPAFNDILRRTRNSINIYGKKDEIALFESFFHNLENDLVEENEKIAVNLILLMQSRIRKELNI